MGLFHNMFLSKSARAFPENWSTADVMSSSIYVILEDDTYQPTMNKAQFLKWRHADLKLPGSWTAGLIFLLAGWIWISLSDVVLHSIVQDAETRETIQSVKGIAFVLLVAAAVFFLVRHYSKQINAHISRQERMNDDLSLFLHKVVHDLRSPVNHIIGLSYLTTAECMDEKAKDYIKKIEERAVSLRSTIDSLNSLLEMDRKTVVEKLHIAPLTEEIVSAISGNYADAGVEVRSHILPELTFSANRAILQSILQNLIENAFKYSLNTGRKPIVTIAIESTDNLLHIHVSDNGQGIDQKNLNRVFEKFFRERYRSSEGNDVVKGSGLGLYITKAMVEKLEGYINLESTAGSGTTFHVALPIKAPLKN